MLVHQPDLEPAGVWAFQEHDFSSFEELAFKLGMKASWIGGEMRAGLYSESYTATTNIAIEFAQSFYTFSVNDFIPATSVFTDRAKAADLSPNYTGPNNPLAYVSSVTYGRKAFLVISSKMERSKLHQYVSLTANYMIGGAQANQELEVRRFLAQVETKVWMYGGPVSSTSVIEARDRVAALKSAISASPAQLITSGLPISYRVNYLVNSRPAALNLATDFTVVNYAYGSDPSVRIDFKTGSQDKDHDTKVAVALMRPPVTIDPTNAVAYFHYAGGSKWSPDDVNGFDLVTQNPFSWADIGGMALVLRVSANGSDDWDFTPTLTVTSPTGKVHRQAFAAQEFASPFKPNLLGLFAFSVSAPPKLDPPDCPIPGQNPVLFR